MKTYRTPSELQARIEQVLTRRPSPTAAPLDEVAEILSAGRHYAWIGIYLRVGPGPAAASPTEKIGPRTVVPIALGRHILGALEVQGSEDGKPVAGEDRILLKRVAARLAGFLHGPGAYLVRKAREAAAEPPQPSDVRHQPASEKARERTLAAGEGRR